VWVVWPSRDLVVWSRERLGWINLLSELMNPDEEPAELAVLQDAGAGVLDPDGPAGPSPCYFMATCQEADSGSS
jgi:hypothetical protein